MFSTLPLFVLLILVSLTPSLSYANPAVLLPDGKPILHCLDQEIVGMACIPGGSLVRGTKPKHTCEQPENRRSKTTFSETAAIWVQSFYMDKTEVTFAAYQQCVQEKKCRKSRPFYGDFDRPNQPMMGMTWYDANQYCKAQGKRLPTEAEWEHAARGPNHDQGPFGNETVTCEQAIIKDVSGRSCGVKKKGSKPHIGRVWEVAQKPAGHYGLFDMVGNAEEWVADWFTPDLNDCGEECAGVNPQGICGGKEKCKQSQKKVVKGGSWYWSGSHATGWHRRPHYPKNKPYHHFGFRCAASLQQQEK